LEEELDKDVVCHQFYFTDTVSTFLRNSWTIWRL